MSRHRNIRAMDLDEEYEGYYSCYGHSVEDDSCISPRTEAQFLYDRDEKKQPISEYLNLQSTAEEELNSEDNHFGSQGSSQIDIKELSPSDLAKLRSCVESMQNVVGDTIPESTLMKAAKDCSFDFEKSLDSVLRGITSSSVDDNKKEVKESVIEENKCLENIGKLSISSVDRTLQTTAKQTERVNCREEVQRNIEYGSNRLMDIPSQSIKSSSTQSDSCNSAVKSHLSRNVLDIYQTERASGNPLLNLVVIGHVDAGKSTLMGHLLFKLGFVSKKTMHKYEQDSKKLGKASFMYAWVLDETSEERSRGITMDVAQSKFETPNRVVNLLDAPGHKDFIPNMITGAAQADVAILVVDATRGEFETGFEAGGQTREHTMLIRSLGVSQLAVAVNKMDNVKWEKERYSEIVSKLSAFLKQAGFKDSDVQFTPCSGLTGENLIQPAEAVELRQWYSGPTLVQVIDSFKPPERLVSKPLRMCVNDVFKGMGSGFCVSGRLEAGFVQNGDKVLIMPLGEQAVVRGISIDDSVGQYSFAGDNVVLQLSGVDMNGITGGSVVCDINCPVKVTNYFQARLVVFNIKIPITKGFPVVLHFQSLCEQAIITKLISQLHRNTGAVQRTNPRCLAKHSSAVVEVKVSRPICMEIYKDFKDLGRFMLRSGGLTIAAGVVTEVL